MKRRPLNLLLSLLAAAATAWAAFAPADWQYRQRIAPTGAVTRAALTAAVYDSAVYDGTGANLADLRVVRDHTAEVPYLLTIAHATRQTSEAPVRLVNREQRDGTLWVTLELAAGAEPHNQLQLAVARDDFRSQLTLEASDDGRQWATVRQSAYIFRYRTGDGQVAEHTTLRYPDSRRRYLRLALANWPDAAALTGATVRRETATAATRSLVSSINDPAHISRQGSTCVELATGTRTPRDLAVLTVASHPPVFHRSVTLEQSDDGHRWRWLAAGAVYRIRGEESLAVPFPETGAPRQRLCVFQGDDPPLQVTRVELKGVDRLVSFPSQTPGTYWLYYGAARAARPQYDLAQTAGADFAATAEAGTLGPQEANPAYQAPTPPVAPWTERYPALLYTALAVAVAGLGWLALRLLRAPV